MPENINNNNPEGVTQKSRAMADAKTEEAKAIVETFQHTRDKYLAEMSQAFEKRLSRGRQSLGQDAIKKMEQLSCTQKKELETIFDTNYDKLKASTQNGVQERQDLARTLLNSASNTAKGRVQMVETIFNHYVKDRHVTNEEVLQIENALKGLEKLNNEHPALQRVAAKINDKVPLVKEDYQSVVEIIKVSPISENMRSIKEVFDTSSAGVLIGLMDIGQRYALVQEMIKSNKRDSVGDFVESMILTGALTQYHAEKLFKEALDKGAITKQKYDSYYRVRLENGFYTKLTEDYKKVVQTEINNSLAGGPADNIFHRFVGNSPSGSPFLYLLGTAWSAVTIGVNAFTCLKKGDPAQTLKLMATNPYIQLGAATGAFCWNGFSGGMENRGFMGGDVVRALDSMSEKNRKQALNDNADLVLKEIYFNSPSGLREYFKNGGFKTLQDIKNEMISAKKIPNVTLKNLIEREKNNPQQLALLESQTKMTQLSEADINNRIMYISEACHILKINTLGSFNEKIDKLAA